MKTLLCTLLVCPLLNASILHFLGTPMTTVVLDKVQIPVYKAAIVNIPQESIDEFPVFLTGSGRYTKQVGFISANVYYAQSFIDSAEGFKSKIVPSSFSSPWTRGI